MRGPLSRWRRSMDEQAGEQSSLTTVHFRIEPSDLTQTSTGSIVGPIWLQVADLNYPEPGWTDFPVALLGAWLQAVLNIHGGRQQRAECYFMDGPYGFIIETRGDMIWHLGLIEADSKVRAEFDVHPYGFSGSLAATAGQLMNTCRERGWSGRDLEVLKALHGQRQHA
jgi:hypothetical protein